MAEVVLTIAEVKLDEKTKSELEKDIRSVIRLRKALPRNG